MAVIFSGSITFPKLVQYSNARTPIVSRLSADDILWLWHRELYTRVCRYWQKLGVLFPLTVEKTNEHLDGAGLIRASYETRGNGMKKLYICKSSLPGRSRMLVLNETLARKYLENETD